MGRRIKDIILGTRFSKLTVIAFGDNIDRGAGKHVRWWCRCDCGKDHLVQGTSLRNGSITSCGCTRIEKQIAAIRRRYPISRQCPEYTSWFGACARCKYPKNKAYAYYGGRGIRMCDRWQSPQGFQHFYVDMGPKPEPKRAYSLDRINVNGNYEPTNCRWALRAVQHANRRSFADLLQLECGCARCPVHHPPKAP